MPRITIGKDYLFTYPDYGTPDNYPAYTAHSGQVVKVVSKLAEVTDGLMYRIQASDGWTGTARLDELSSKNAKQKSTTQLYLVVVWGDVEPAIEGPFDDEEKRADRAVEIRKGPDGRDHGLYALEIKDGVPEFAPGSVFGNSDDEEDAE